MFPVPTPQKKTTQQTSSFTREAKPAVFYNTNVHVPPSFPAPAAQVENVPMDIDRSRNRAPPRRDTKEWLKRLCVTNRINVRWYWNKRVPRCGRVDELFTREDRDRRFEKWMS